MKRFLASLVIVVLCALLVGLTGVRGQDSSGSGKFRRVRAEKRIHEQYIVVLKNDADPNLEAARLSREYSGDRSGGYTYYKAIKGFSVRMPEAAALRMANDPRVEFIEEDSEVQTVATQ